MYGPNNATSKYKLILRFITVNYVGICINFWQNRLSLTHALLSLHFYHHYCPCTVSRVIGCPWIILFKDRKHENAHISATISPIYMRFFSLEAEIKGFHLSHRNTSYFKCIPGKKTVCKSDLWLLRYGHFCIFCHSMGLIPLKYFCCVIEPSSIEPLIASLITHDSFPLSSEAVPSTQLQIPEYLTTCIPVLWALLL